MMNADFTKDRAFDKNADVDPQFLALQESTSSIRNKFLIMSSQAGVGKTSAVVNLAMTLSKRGLKVGLMDLNIQSQDIHKMLGLEFAVKSSSDKQFMPTPYSDALKLASIESVMSDREENGVWRDPPKISDIRSFIASVNWGSLDYLFIDTPSGPCEELLAAIRSIIAAETIIVTAPNMIGADRAKEMINFFKKENIPIFGWIENMRGFLCQRCGQPQELFSSGSGSRAVFLMDIPFLGRIPIDPNLSECIDAGEPFMEKYPDSQVAEAYSLLSERIIKETQWRTHSGQL